MMSVMLLLFQIACAFFFPIEVKTLDKDSLKIEDWMVIKDSTEIAACECINQIMADYLKIYQPIVNSTCHPMSFFIGCTSMEGTTCDAILQICPEDIKICDKPYKGVISTTATVKGN